MRKDDMAALDALVRSATWEDAKATFTNPVLVGPPTLEFATYKKVPNTKKRTDGRQGTIDQDPEFMAFLESLANPVPMRESIDVEDPEGADTDAKITTTPLVEYLKQKKASKGKDKNAKSKGKAKDDDAKKRRDVKEKDKKPAKEVKILTKEEKKIEPADEAPKSRRAGIAAAARILQRDLGLSPGTAHRRARHDAAKADVEPKTQPEEPAPAKTEPKGRRKGKAEKPETTPTPTPPPVILKKSEEQPPPKQSPPAKEKKAAKAKKPPVAGARAFVKNANTAQGVTDETLREALGAFGTVTHIDIDKRKGFAFVDFAEADGLAKAMAAGGITVAQATVTVQERKEKKPPAKEATATDKPDKADKTEKAEKTDKQDKPDKGRRRRGKASGRNTPAEAPV